LTNAPVPSPANPTASSARPDHNHPASTPPPTIRPTVPADDTPTAALSLDTGGQPDATPTGSDGVAEPGQRRKRPRVETDALDGRPVIRFSFRHELTQVIRARHCCHYTTYNRQLLRSACRYPVSRSAKPRSNPDVPAGRHRVPGPTQRSGSVSYSILEPSGGPARFPSSASSAQCQFCPPSS
jgi:hypothetical protein